MPVAIDIAGSATDQLLLTHVIVVVKLIRINLGLRFLRLAKALLILLTLLLLLVFWRFLLSTVCMLCLHILKRVHKAQTVGHHKPLEFVCLPIVANLIIILANVLHHWQTVLTAFAEEL